MHEADYISNVGCPMPIAVLPNADDQIHEANQYTFYSLHCLNFT